MNNNLPGLLLIPEEQTRTYFVRTNISHTISFFLPALIKNNLLLPNTEQASSLRPCFPTPTGRGFVLEETLLTTRWGLFQTRRRDLRCFRKTWRWRQAAECGAGLRGDHLQRQAETYQQPRQQRRSPATSSCVLTCPCWKVKFCLSTRPQSCNTCRNIHRGMCMKGELHQQYSCRRSSVIT